MPYNDKLDSAAQVDAEEKIAAAIFDRVASVPEEVCSELGRTILHIVLSDFREDLMEDQKPLQKMSCGGCGGSRFDVRSDYDGSGSITKLYLRCLKCQSETAVSPSRTDLELEGDDNGTLAPFSVTPGRKKG